MKNNINFIIYSFFCLGILFQQNADAGVMIEQIEGSTSFSGTIKTVHYYSNDDLRTDDIDGRITTIFRFGKDIGYFISHKKKSFLEYNLSERAKKLQKNSEQNKENKMEETTGTPYKKKEIVKTDETKKICGLNTFKVNIVSEGKILEENWITSDIDLSEVKNIIAKMKQTHNYKFDPDNDEFIIANEIEKMGFVLLTRRYSYFLGEKNEDYTEITKIEKLNIPEKTFLPPANYKKLK